MHTENPTELLVMMNKEKNKRKILDHESKERERKVVDKQTSLIPTYYPCLLYLYFLFMTKERKTWRSRRNFLMMMTNRTKSNTNTTVGQTKMKLLSRLVVHILYHLTFSFISFLSCWFLILVFPPISSWLPPSLRFETSQRLNPHTIQ